MNAAMCDSSRAWRSRSLAPPLNRHYPLRLSRWGHICGHIGARILHLEVQRIDKGGVQDAQPK